MRRHSLIVVVALAITFTLVPYVRRGVVPRRATAAVVVGSRDRLLHGKARVRARKAT